LTNTNDALFAQAVRALNVGDLRLAEASFKRFLTAFPNHSGALNLLTVVLVAKGRFEEAEPYIAKAVGLDASSDSSFYNYGVILKALGRPSEALAQFDRALAINPAHFKAWSNRGSCLNDLEQHERALADFDNAIALNPRHFEANYNKGNALSALDRPESACAAFDAALAVNPASPEAHNNRALALQELGRIEEAMAGYDKAVALKPDYVDGHWNRSLLHLLTGDFERGWRDYEWRNLREPARRQSFAKPLWTGGQPISGKTLLVHAEQGLGDTIHFCRYVRAACDAGARVMFAPQERLQTLMQTLGGCFEIAATDDQTLEFDFHCPLLSLPLVFGTRLETIPGETPYLSAQPERVARWAERLGGHGFKIGVCWQGSAGKIDQGRSFPLTQFLEIARLPQVRLISLQKGEGLSQIKELPADVRLETLGDAFDPENEGFLDTAAVMKTCDLVITCDTAVAHLAGALAAPTWVALKRAPDWRWMLERADSPWYPTVRLFRQSVRGNWGGVFADMKMALQSLLDERGRDGCSAWRSTTPG
jgi:tetratricopeptide (TPR) repeat protein